MRVASSAALAALVIVVSAVPAWVKRRPRQRAPSKKAWTPPRTPDGQPDLQGVWTNNTVTPLERPKDLAGKEFYTDAELAAGMKKEHERLDLNEEEGRPTQPGTADDVHYDFSEYGLDRAQTKLAWNKRTSIIVGPDGVIPPLTPEAAQAAGGTQSQGQRTSIRRPREYVAERAVHRPGKCGPAAAALGLQQQFADCARRRICGDRNGDDSRRADYSH